MSMALVCPPGRLWSVVHSQNNRAQQDVMFQTSSYQVFRNLSRSPGLIYTILFIHNLPKSLKLIVGAANTSGCTDAMHPPCPNTFSSYKIDAQVVKSCGMLSKIWNQKTVRMPINILNSIHSLQFDLCAAPRIDYAKQCWLVAAPASPLSGNGELHEVSLLNQPQLRSHWFMHSLTMAMLYI